MVPGNPGNMPTWYITIKKSVIRQTLDGEGLVNVVY